MESIASIKTLKNNIFFKLILLHKKPYKMAPTSPPIANKKVKVPINVELNPNLFVW